MSGFLRRAALASLAAVLTAPGVAAQGDQPLPEQLQEVGVTQRLNESIPLDLAFNDELGHRVKLRDLFGNEGRPVLLSLVYYRCPMLCTLVLEGMVDALRGIDWVPGREFEVVTLSIDPRETHRLAQMKKKNHVSAYGRPEAAAGWHFLTGEAEPIRKLADAVGFHYRYIEETGEFAHPAVLFVITPEGRISRYLFGVLHDPRTVRLSLVEASAGKIGTLADKFLLYCYRYDPEAGRYAPVALKIMRAGGVLGAVILGAVLLTFWIREARQKKKLA